MMAVLALAYSCEKDKRVPPALELKSGSGYVYTDTTLGLQDTFKVSVKATKTEDELNTFNVSYAYDGASTTTTSQNITLSKSQYNGYENDFSLVTRNQAGKEKWVFTVTDRDGNVTNKSVTITVK